MLDKPQAEVAINTSQNRFELRLNGDLVGIMGFYQEERAGRPVPRPAPVMSYMHTVITEDFGHRGLASVLVQGALDYARRVGWKVRPVCTYVQRFVAERPEYRDLVSGAAAASVQSA